MKRYFITGTDTGCGKTYTTCQLLTYFLKQNKQVLALKPVASGLIKQNAKCGNEDVLILEKHNPKTTQRINHWQFTSPIAPHIAAINEKKPITALAIADFCAKDKWSGFEGLLIEGAGGLLVPLNARETWMDFLKITNIPTILVVGMRLGCLNHALLTDTVLKVNQIPCAGWIATCLNKDMLAFKENLNTLISKMHQPLLATLPYQKEFTANSLLDQLF